MKKLLPLILLLSSNSYAIDKVIYGHDNRVDPINANQMWDTMTSASVVKMKMSQVIAEEEDAYIVTSAYLKDAVEICSDETYSFPNQFVAGECSGVLVSSQVILTAGHCIDEKDDNSFWLFDYHESKIDKIDEKSFRIPKENMFFRKDIIVKRMEGNKEEGATYDYGLIKLDRKVTGRSPVRFRQDGEIEVGAPVVSMGYPLGLPLKVSGGAQVRSSEHEAYFRANLDTFVGNSGSPVYNQETGLLEGVLVRGEDDFFYDEDHMCIRWKRCEDSSCRGEDVNRVTVITELFDY